MARLPSVSGEQAVRAWEVAAPLDRPLDLVSLQGIIGRT